MNTLAEITAPPAQPIVAAPPDPRRAHDREIGGPSNEDFRHTADNIKQNGNDALHAAKEAGNQFVEDQKEKVAVRIDHYTEAVKAACETLQSTEGNPLVSPAQRASLQMERAAEYLRGHHAVDFFNDLGSLARRRPEIVFGGLFVLGLASMRFLKASSRDHRSSRNPNERWTGKRRAQPDANTSYPAAIPNTTPAL